jgi:hypothetical protein
MKTLSLFAIAAAAVLSALLPVQVQADTVDGKSSTKDLVWVARSTSDGGELFVSWAHGGTGAKVADLVGLGALKVHFSSDDRWLFVTDGGSSLGTTVRLFKRSTGLAYKEVKEFDFDFAVQRLAAQIEGGKEIKDTILDRSYLRCVGWSKDGPQAFLAISGKGTLNGKRFEVEDFTCVFDPVARVFSAVKKK